MMKPAKFPLFVLMAFGMISCQIIPFTTSPTATPILLPTEITDAKGVTMRLVPAGAFIMGSDNGTDTAKPAHAVTLDNFYMDIYEVTKARYKECVDNGVCSDPKDAPSINLFYAEPNHPMAAVDWNQSKTYCGTWRGARLPTEAEWEKAARGTDGRTYPWGEEFDSTYVNYNSKSDGVVDVGSYEKGKSPYGMYDMSGSVWEWTADLSLPYAGNQADPSYYRVGERITRGGTWYNGDVFSWSTTFRYPTFPEDEEYYIGFRCAKDANP